MLLRQCACLLFVLLLTAWPAFADSKARIVRLSYVEGEAELDRGDGRGFVRAFQNMPVIEGVRLLTRANARVEVEFEDGGTLRLAPDSQVSFEELRLGDSGEKITHVALEEGTLYANLKDHDHDQLAFSFAHQQLRLRQSSRFRIDINQEQLNVAVFRGELELERANAEHVKIKKNETLAVDFAEPERYYLSKGIIEGSEDYWDREREEQHVAAENHYRSNSYSAGSAYSSMAYYGYDDLASYGSWTSYPSYGYLWQPYGVNYAWNPFGYGAWVWYPRFGYIWTSAYPWGWTPFRFGSWVFVNGHGWCWRSGPRIPFNNFNIVNAPPHFVRPHPPLVNNAPIVAVVAGNHRPAADPLGDWMPRPGPREGGSRFVNDGATPRIGERRALINDAGAGENAAPGTRAGVAARDIQRNPGTSTKAGINESPRTRTLDKDYDAIDYRRTPAVNRADRPPTTPSNDVVGASRDQRGRPDPDRDDISRPGTVNRGPAAEERLTTPDVEGPQRNSSPAIGRDDSRSGPSMGRPTSEPQIARPTPEPRIERPAPSPRVETPQPRMETPQPRIETPRVDRPAPPPSMPRETPRASMPQRSYSPPPSAPPVQRSSPPPAMSAPRPAPAPAMSAPRPAPAPAMSAPRAAPAPAPAAAPRAGAVRDR
jgi:hypothetical protein